MPDRTGGPPIEWVKADFSAELARKRAYVAAHWPSALIAGEPGRWVRKRKRKGDPVDLVEPPPPVDVYAAAETRYFNWRPAIPPMSADAAEARVAEVLSVLQPTGIPFLDLALWKGRFPSSGQRFCTETLKVEVIESRIVEPLLSAGVSVVSWQGVRAEESPARALMPSSQFVRQHAGGGRLWVFRPIHRWTTADVFAMHARHGLVPNELYSRGFSRVGCMPCIMSRKAEVRRMAAQFPEHVDRLEAWERAVALASRRGIGAFFGVDKTATHYDLTKPIPGIREVVAWSNTSRGGRQYDAMLTMVDDVFSCPSTFGACE